MDNSNNQFSKLATEHFHIVLKQAESLFPLLLRVCVCSIVSVPQML